MVSPVRPAVAYNDALSGIHKAEIIYNTPVSSILGLHGINQYIHSISALPPVVEFVIFFFGYAFNPVSVPIWVIAATLVGAAPTFILEDPQQQLAADGSSFARLLFAPAFYLASLLVTLVATEISKASFRATRPEAILSKQFLSTKLRRYGTLVASLKSKHSFPSGDSAQAANAVLWLYLYTLPSWTKNNTKLTLMVQLLAFGVFYPGVAFARIFYFCHWIEDCLGGAILAGLLHATIMPVVSDVIWHAVVQMVAVASV